MAHAHDPGTLDNAHPEALTNEVLKLKIDDLFQEIESLKLRLSRLESLALPQARSGPEGSDPAPGVLSNPDRPGPR